MTALGEQIPPEYSGEVPVPASSESVRVKPGYHLAYDPDDPALDHTKVTFLVQGPCLVYGLQGQ
jgi:hypothetical protein